MVKSATVNITGVGPVLLERSARAKHLNITIKPFKGVRVAVPKGVPFKKAEQIARNKTEWLKIHLNRIRKLEKEYEAIPEVEIDREEARTVLVSRLEAIAKKHGYKYNRVSIRNQKTRWGSCSTRNNISLNMKLTLLPGDLCDFILLHELVHTKVKNHSDDFWAELLRVEPNARVLDKRVNQYDLRFI